MNAASSLASIPVANASPTSLPMLVPADREMLFQPADDAHVRDPVGTAAAEYNADSGRLNDDGRADG